MTRMPVVANQFYPGDPDLLRSTLHEFIPPVDTTQKACAVISPHAGYIYSGAVAGETFAPVTIPDDIIILGPNHHGQGAAVGMMAQGVWEMPMGNVPINSTLADLLTIPPVEQDELSHRYEHSLEVQVPFLQYLNKNISIVPMVISHISFALCVDVAEIISSAIQKYDKPVLIVASTDMSHYESRQSASHKDNLALQQINKLDAQGLYDTVTSNRISMCGFIPTTIALLASLQLGAKKANIVRYTDSGAVSGDINQVVGYAGVIIS